MLKQIKSILKPYGIKEVEYRVLVCVHYGMALNPKDMASYTVLAVEGGAGDTYNADEYFIAIHEMINKGWLKLITKKDKAVLIKKDREKLSYPRPESFDDPIGTVVFSRKGYLLHREILIQIHGQHFVDQSDSFVVLNEDERQVTFYGRTLEVCDDWLFEMQQVSRASSHLMAIVDEPAQVTKVLKPQKMGQWRPSDHLTLDEGFECGVSYELFEVRRFDVEALNLRSTFTNYHPIYISGTIGEKTFSFSEIPSWQPKPDERPSDANARYHWRFKVESKTAKSRPPEAQLKGESQSRFDTSIPHWDYVQKEDGRRRQMLNADEAEEVLHATVVKFLKCQQGTLD